VVRRIEIELSPKTMLIAAGVIAGAWVFLQLWPILLVLACALMLVGGTVGPREFSSSC